MEENQKTTYPPKKNKFASYIRNLFRDANKDISEEEVEYYSSLEDFRSFMPELHSLATGKKSPHNEAYYDSIYNNLVYTEKNKGFDPSLQQSEEFKPLLKPTGADPEFMKKFPDPDTLNPQELAEMEAQMEQNYLRSPERIKDEQESLENSSFVEKKNQVQSTANSLESSGILQEDPYQSGSPLEKAKIDPRLKLKNINTLNSAVSFIDKDFLSKDSKYVLEELQNRYSKYNFLFQADGDNAIIVSAPTGITEKFPLFPDEIAQGRLGSQENFDAYVDLKTKEFASFMLNNGDKSAQYIETYLGQSDNVDDLKKRITSIRRDNDARTSAHIKNLFNEPGSPLEFLRAHTGNAEDLLNKTNSLLNKLGDKSEDSQNILRAYGVQKDQMPDFLATKRKQADRFIEDFRKSKMVASAQIGKMLETTNKYKLIDLKDQDQIIGLEKAGLNRKDIPTDFIRINGIPTSINEATRFIYQYDNVKKIQYGEVSLEVEASENAGVIEKDLINFMRARDIQRALGSKHLSKGALEGDESLALKLAKTGAKEGAIAAERFIDAVGDNIQKAGISAARSFGDVGYLAYDALRLSGVDEDTAEALVYSTYGVFNVSALKPDLLDAYEETNLPYFEGGYTDATGFDEVIYRLSNDLATAMPHILVFRKNNVAGLALTFGSSYGFDRRQFDNLKKDIEDKKQTGQILTSEEQNILNTSQAESIVNSLTKAGYETAFTSLFTSKYMQNVKFLGSTLSQAKELAPETVRVVIQKYAREQRHGIAGKIAKTLGVDVKSVLNQLPEEELIVFTDYLYDVSQGYETYDKDKARKMFVETGISSVGSAYGLSKIANYGQDAKTKEIAKQIIKDNLTLEQELPLRSDQLSVEQQKAKVKEALENNEKKPQEDQEYNYLEGEAIRISSEIDRIDKMKDDLINKMSFEDRNKFLEIYTDIIDSNKAMISDETISPQTQKKINDNIERLREEARGVIRKYPTRLGYYFAEDQMKQEIEIEAIDQLKKEAEDRGESFEAMLENDPRVIQRSEQIFKDRMQEGVEVELDVFEYESPVFIPREKVEPTETISFNALAEGKVIRDNQRISDITVEEISEENLSQISTEKSFDDTVFDNDIEPVLLNVERLDADYGLENLDPKQLKEITDFYKNLQKGSSQGIGNVRSIINAQDNISQLEANYVEPIKLEEYGKNKTVGFITDKLSGNKFTDQLGTLDIAAQTLFRNQAKAEPFMNVFNQVRRTAAEAENTSNQLKDSHLELYKKESNGQNPNAEKNSYEMSLLSGFKRETTGKKNKEFPRVKKLYLEKLVNTKKLSEKSISESDKEYYTDRYNTLKEVYEKLDIANAKSYDDIASKAESYNVSAVDRFTTMFSTADATKRINDYEKHKAYEFKEGTYTPFFMSKNGSNYETYSANAKAGTSQLTSHLQDVTRPEELGADLDVNMDLFFDNIYRAHRSVNMDINTKEPLSTYQYMVESERFADLFEDSKSKETLLNQFKEVPNQIRRDIEQSKVRPLTKEEVNSLSKNDRFKIYNNIYGTASTAALSRISQRASQYYSATLAGYILLNNKKAGNYLLHSIYDFTTFSAQSTTPNQRGIDMRKANYLATKTADKSNIYRMSRTGQRNAVSANLALERDVRYPASYYIKQFGIEGEAAGTLSKIPGKLGYDRFMEAWSKTNEFNLEFFLAKADKLAANALFEAAYIDYRINQGDKLEGKMSEWWKKQNENPDKEAINYADQIIAKMMRQTDQASEAPVYRQDAKPGVKNFFRVFYPFGKFVMNARTDLANQVRILNDPKSTMDMRDMARKTITARSSEILTYNAIKYAASVAMIQGMAGIVNFGEEEEMIERLGGMTRLIGSGVLPIEHLGTLEVTQGLEEHMKSKGIDPYKKLEDAKSIEEYSAILNASVDGIVSLNGIKSEFMKYRKEYENKFTLANQRDPLTATVQDFVQSMNIIPLPQVGEAVLAASFNEIYGEDIATEYFTDDIGQVKSTDDLLSFMLENSGLIGLAAEQVSSFVRAFKLAKGLFMVNPEFGTEEHLYAPNDYMRRELIQATQFLYGLRLHSIINPALPSADLDRMADKLERAIQQNFTTKRWGVRNAPSERLYDMKDAGVLPIITPMTFGGVIGEIEPEPSEEEKIKQKTKMMRITIED